MAAPFFFSLSQDKSGKVCGRMGSVPPPVVAGHPKTLLHCTQQFAPLTVHSLFVGYLSADMLLYATTNACACACAAWEHSTFILAGCGWQRPLLRPLVTRWPSSGQKDGSPPVVSSQTLPGLPLRQKLTPGPRDFSGVYGGWGTCATRSFRDDDSHRLLVHHLPPGGTACLCLSTIYQALQILPGKRYGGFGGTLERRRATWPWIEW